MFKYGLYNNVYFNEVFDNLEDFITQYKATDLYDSENCLSDQYCKLLYSLLMARYGNDVIAPNSIDRFKLQLFALIFQHGPTWEKRVKMQNTLRSLSEEELMRGTKQIYNQAQNPSVEPGTFSDEELTFINAQNTTGVKRGKVEAYAMLETMLRTDYSEEFLSKFKKLFLSVVAPICPDFYINKEFDYE